MDPCVASSGIALATLDEHLGRKILKGNRLSLDAFHVNFFQSRRGERVKGDRRVIASS